MNLVMVSGNVGADPEVRWSQGAEPICIANISLGVRRDFKDHSGNYGTDWLRVKAFGKRAEFVEKYVKKGSGIEVSGRIQTGSYDKDGQKVYFTEIVADKVEFGKGGSKSDNQSGLNATQNNAAPQNNTPSAPNAGIPDGGFMNIPDGLDEELPFN